MCETDFTSIEKLCTETENGDVFFKFGRQTIQITMSSGLGNQQGGAFNTYYGFHNLGLLQGIPEIPSSINLQFIVKMFTFFSPLPFCVFFRSGSTLHLFMRRPIRLSAWS